MTLSPSRTVVLSLLQLAIACSGCSPNPPSAPGSDGGSSEGERVTGSERISWTQAAPTRKELDSYEYIAYVDNQRRPMGKASCQESSSDEYTCSAPLPAMAPGRRVLELAASVAGAESARSSRIVLWVGAAVAQWSPNAPTAHVAGALRQTRDCDPSAENCHDLEVLADDLPESHSLVVLPDGRVLIVIEGQRILSLRPSGNKYLEVDSPCAPTSCASVVSVAADPQFAANRILYLAWRCDNETDETPEMLVARYREVDGILGEAAVIHSQAFRGDTRPLLSIGSDHSVFVAVAGARYWSLLRMTPDGSVPATNPGKRLAIGRANEMRALRSHRTLPLTVLLTDTQLQLFGEHLVPTAVSTPDLPNARFVAFAPEDAATCLAGGTTEIVLYDLAAVAGKQVASPGGRLKLPGLGLPSEIATGPTREVYVLARDPSRTVLYRLRLPIVQP